MSVTLHTTHGPLKIEVFLAPHKTAENFLALCASGAYTNSRFHRNLPTFMIQGGSVPVPPLTNPPTRLSKNPPSTSIYGALFEDEIRPELRHNARGVVSMANKGPNSNGSQFFVLYKASPHLDGLNTVFGKVIEGMETLDVLEGLEVDEKGRLKEVVAIERAEIHANPLAG